MLKFEKKVKADLAESNAELQICGQELETY